VGKRRPALENTPYTIPDDISSLRQLIAALVQSEVAVFNSRTPSSETGIESGKQSGRELDNRIISFLTEAEITDASTVGKVSFGRIYSNQMADVERALKTAVQGFEDGLFRVMIGENEAVDLDAPLEIPAGETLTFIRLTFLSGRLW